MITRLVELIYSEVAIGEPRPDGYRDYTVHLHTTDGVLVASQVGKRLYERSVPAPYEGDLQAAARTAKVKR